MTVQLEANQEVMRLAVMFTQKALHMVVVAVGARCISRSSTDHVITLKQPSVSSGPRVRCLKVNWRLKQTEPRPRYIQTLTIFGIENSVECQYSFIVTTLLQGLRFKSKFWENVCTAARINPVQRYKVWFSKRMEWSIHPSMSVPASSLLWDRGFFLLEPIPAASGREQDAPWTSRQLIRSNDKTMKSGVKRSLRC